VLNASGFQIQQRDRTSVALLNQIAGQWIGKFFEQKLRLEVGIRRPFFKRDLNTHCPIQTNGFAYCTDEPILARGTTLINQPSSVPNASIPIFVNLGDVIPTGAIARAYNFVYAPFKAEYKYGKILPNVGFTYNVTPVISVFGSWAKGFSAPRTDNLYNAPIVLVKPEETNAFDLGARYTSSIVQAQAAVWKIDYTNRIVTSFNQELGISIDRNVGKVNSWGFDASVAVRPVRPLMLLALASYIKAKLKQNVEFNTAAFNPLIVPPNPQVPPAGLIFCDAPPTATNTPVLTCAPTKGKMVAETPKWQFGGRAQYEIGPFSFGAQAKRVGARFATDVNDVRVKGYTIVDLDARASLDSILHTKGTYLQLNLQNLFDKFYFGNLSTQINAGGNPNYAVGSPRTFSATLNVGL
jgi:iron complex outermembrane receptor protein